jgi:hypothetical protein
MSVTSEQPQLEGWEPFIGTWATEATHPGLPATVVQGESTFEWLDGRRFVVGRWRYDDPRIPDAIAIIGVIDDRLVMHYYDYRGVFRVYEVGLDGTSWRYWRDAPGFAQRFTGTFSDDGDTIDGYGELSRDGSTWGDDLTITYRRRALRPG